MESNKMTYWDMMKDVPEIYLKKIQAGRLKGKSDISPQWRIMKMTEVFGPVGIGWNYRIVEKWTESHGDEVSAHVIIELVYMHEGKLSLPVQGIGGSMILAKEKNGPYHSDEAFKMATTDALSVAMKQIGVAANIYLGKMDGSKYSKPEENMNKSRPVVKYATPDQIATLTKMAVEMETTNPAGSDFITNAINNKENPLTMEEAQKLINRRNK